MYREQNGALFSTKAVINLLFEIGNNYIVDCHMCCLVENRFCDCTFNHICKCALVTHTFIKEQCLFNE